MFSEPLFVPPNGADVDDMVFRELSDLESDIGTGISFSGHIHRHKDTTRSAGSTESGRGSAADVHSVECDVGPSHSSVAGMPRFLAGTPEHSDDAGFALFPPPARFTPTTCARQAQVAAASSSHPEQIRPVRSAGPAKASVDVSGGAEAPRVSKRGRSPAVGGKDAVSYAPTAHQSIAGSTPNPQAAATAPAVRLPAFADPSTSATSTVQPNDRGSAAEAAVAEARSAADMALAQETANAQAALAGLTGTQTELKRREWNRLNARKSR